MPLHPFFHIHIIYIHTNTHIYTHTAVVACANIDSGPLNRTRILDFGVLERREMFGLSLPG